MVTSKTASDTQDVSSNFGEATRSWFFSLNGSWKRKTTMSLVKGVHWLAYRIDGLTIRTHAPSVYSYQRSHCCTHTLTSTAAVVVIFIVLVECLSTIRYLLHTFLILLSRESLNPPLTHVLEYIKNSLCSVWEPHVAHLSYCFIAHSS